MTCMLKPHGTCLPVTALQSGKAGQNVILLAGQGPYVHAYNGNGHQILSVRVFVSQPVHGIVTAANDNSVHPYEHHQTDVVIWGGSLMRFGRLAVGVGGRDPSAPEFTLHLAREFDSGDWILDIAVLGASIWILTAHNVLFRLLLHEGDSLDLSRYEKLSVVQGPATFLYSAQLVVARHGVFIVASGTVFGEILVWTCSKQDHDQEWSTQLKHVFNGHTGSVFGVAISKELNLNNGHKRLLASCSDDRTIRIWDISDCDQLFSDTNTPLMSTETGFGSATHAKIPQLASAWGHLSRIWGVEFLKTPQNQGCNGVHLLSRGEDAACQLWSIETSKEVGPSKQTTAQITPVSNDRYHSGKNAWSMSQLSEDHSVTVFTGGADGQIISRRFDTISAAMNDSVTYSIPFKEVTSSSNALKHYLLRNQSECLATTDQGHLFLLTIKNGTLNWKRISKSTSKGGLSICNSEVDGVTLLATQQGDLSVLRQGDDAPISIPISLESGVSWIRCASNQTPNSPASPNSNCIVVVLSNQHAVILWLTKDGSSFRLKKTTLKLPDTFTIASICYDRSNQILFLGSRAGALAIYSDLPFESEDSGEPFCLRHIHGSDCVTSINILGHTATTSDIMGRTSYILTTGRDGNYAIHRLDWDRQSTHYIEPTFSTIHLSSLPFGPNIEGAYFSHQPEGKDPHSTTVPDLVLYGFRSTSFVVWNETQQSTILSVNCGGAHRTWAYKDSAAYSSRDSSLHSSQQIIPDTRSFVWTKAGKFNWYTARSASHKVILKGGHGREIKAVARSPVLYTHTNSEFYKRPRTLIATGAEDTTIRLFALSGTERFPSKLSDSDHESQLSTTFHSLATLKRHTTGLQHLLFSPSGKYLFSSAGCEEFYAWKLSFDVPCISIGVVLWDMIPQEDEDPDSDARIMSFDLRAYAVANLDIATHPNKNDVIQQEEEKFTLALAYSNGKTKIVQYTPSITARNQGMFETLREINYGTFCVMQASFLSPESSLLGTQTQILSAGTNGFLNLSAINLNLITKTEEKGLELLSPSPSSSQLEVHKTHQSSILAMDIVQLNSDSYLIATGGDDNALGLTLLSADTSTNGTRPPRHNFRTILIPHAHAAAVSALKFMSPKHTATGFSLAAISVGNDQRAKVWSVHIDLEKAAHPTDDVLLEAIHVQRSWSGWTAVADVSGLEIIDGNDQNQALANDDSNVNEEAKQGCRILVTGVGMEVLSLLAME
ncbi:uncharacterized protein Z518_10588 [Rhinocladiella mackenziei CBS 650.93]|uniref:WD repeat protein n=1 Tax=Rhinocladiella mackenziei CBS 650.93 TaxID=1442369 RepID=A0A0D2I3U9_9EURO|nr:uncharacterized protein Z518_10588 [Rhinocladiella mackenziei CBS 650.93]KIX00449.1 hypothetical protein Z518_10588 [Rhinocladiella mackenziei CBS 650.93]